MVYTGTAQIPIVCHFMQVEL